LGPIANGPNWTSVAESPSHPSGFAKPDAAARNACRPDSNTGHLRHHIENGVKVWRVHLSKQDVKNHYSKAMKDGESRLLHNIGGRFYAILEEYLDWVRLPLGGQNL
jgi:hypothetical protein